MDIHKCGDCHKEFDSYENFLIHKLLVEQYKLILETSGRIPSLRLPKFIKVNQTFKPNYGKDENQINPPPVSTSKENSEIEKLKDECEVLSAPESKPTIETAHSPVEVVVDATHLEDAVSDDNSSVRSQPVSLRIDEGGEVKETSSPLSDSTSRLENYQNDCYCKHCKRYYKNKVVLRVHEETVHSSNRPYVCTSCRRGFKTKGSLVRHTRTHTGERPFSCSQCKRAFLDSGTLARHVHRVHRKQPFKQASDMKVLITMLNPDTQNVLTRKQRAADIALIDLIINVRK